MEHPLEDSLFQAIQADNQDAVNSLLSRGANPNKTVSQGKTCLGEAANIGNIEILKLLIAASSSSTSHKSTACNMSRKRQNKCHKRKLKQHEDVVIKCKTFTERVFKDLQFIVDAGERSERNQGYFVIIHSEGSSSDESRLSSKRSPLSPSSLTPSPQADLEWDEDIGNVAPTTSEDETWSSMYKWYAAILESTGAAIASASVVSYGIDQQDSYMRTALHYAAEQGHTAVVNLLIESGCKLDIPAGDGLTPLHVAVVKNHIEIVKVLIKAGSHVNYKTHEKMTPLHFAASRGFLELAKLLISNGAYIEARDTNEKTALYIAAGRGHVDMVKYLISVGANVNGEEIHGYTPLCEAVWQRYAVVVETLLSSGARITHSHRLLHNAIIQRQAEIVKLLVAHGGGINLHNDNGDTPLLIASRQLQPVLARMLLEKGANVNACNSITGASVLHVAVESLEGPENFEALLQVLVEYRVDMDTTALTGDTALNRALLLSKNHAAILLIRYGADVNTCDLHSFGLDNLSIASRRRSNKLASMLLKAGHVIVPDLMASVPSPGCAAHWIYFACKQPLSLSDICRIKIRTIARQRILHKCIFSLPLPKSLKSYLMMEDEGL